MPSAKETKVRAPPQNSYGERKTPVSDTCNYINWFQQLYDGLRNGGIFMHGVFALRHWWGWRSDKDVIGPGGRAAAGAKGVMVGGGVDNQSQ